MYVSGLRAIETTDPTLTYERLDPGISPTYYQDADNLGFSLKSITKAVKKVASPIQKAVGKVAKPVLKVAGKVAAPITSIGAGILRNVPGGGLIVGAVSGVKNLVTGNKGNAVTRMATKTIQASVNALPVAASQVNASLVPTPVAQAKRPTIGQQLQRFKQDPAGTILRAGARLNKQAQSAASKVASTADKAAAVAAAADAAGQAGDALGSRRLRAVADQLKTLAQQGADTAQNVAQALQTGGAAAQGAAAGAVTGAAAEQASQTASSIIDSIPGGKLTVGAAAVGLGFLLLRGKSGGGGGGAYRRGGDVAMWH